MKTTDKKLADNLDKIQKTLKKINEQEKSPLAKLEAAARELRRTLVPEDGPEAYEEGLAQMLDDLDLVLEQVRVAQTDRERFLDRLNVIEGELREVLYQKELLNRNYQTLTRENATATERSRKLEDTLRFTKEEIQKLREEVQKLKAPPLPYGTFIKLSDDEGLMVINVDGKTYEVQVANEDLDPKAFKPGQSLLLNAALNIIALREWKQVGEVARVIDSIDDDRFIVKTRESEERVARRADSLKGTKIKAGDAVMFDPTTDLLFEQLPKSVVEEAVLEEVPEVSYADIGGLYEQVEQIKDAVELPYIYGHLYKQFKLKPPKGILLYGPPGCGKTLIAKAVAYNLSLRIHSFLEENKEAISLYRMLLDETVPFKDVLPRYDAFRSRIYQHQEIYKSRAPKEIDVLYEKLAKSGILGDFIRRTEGDGDEPQLACRYEDWLDLRIELKEKGFGDLDMARVAEMLEEKRRKYFMKRRQVSDREYVTRWLRDYLVNNDVDVEQLDEADKRIEERLGGGVESYFLNIKGPELLNKYVGETEFRIREVFLKAREKASYGLPVIVFFDEMESMFRTRGSGISSDVESTIVPQFLTEIDGVESLKNVIVIGASNRQDLIDPAVLRPGRLDIKIRIDRPDKDAAHDIFTKYLSPDLPFDEAELKEYEGDRAKFCRAIIDAAVEEMYSVKDENRFLKVVYQSREEEILFFKDFSSGAMIEGIVSRAKTAALKRMILTGRRGIRAADLVDAIRGEYKENEDLPNTTNPDDWSKISGRKGERIISIEPMMPELTPKRSDVEEIAVSSRYL